jgi:RNAse (barnase) inhibitor barstar
MKIQELISNGVNEFPQLREYLPMIKKFALENNYKFYLTNAQIQNKDDLFKAFYENCEFPRWFGFNWSALRDCLSDYSFAEAKGYVFALENSSQIRINMGKDFEKFINMFEEVSNRWKLEQIPFMLLLL